MAIEFPNAANGHTAGGFFSSAGVSWSASFWVYFTSFGSGYHNFLGMQGAIVPGLYDTGGWKWNIGTTSNDFAASSGPSTGQWFHVGFVRNGNSKEMFVNGTAVASGSDTATGNTTLSTAVFMDGGEGDSLIGRLAAIKIWEAVLTNAELINEARQYLPERAGVRGFYPLWNIDDNTADYSGHGRTLTLGVIGTKTTADGPPIPWKRGRGRIYVPASGGGGSALTLDISDAISLSDAPANEPRPAYTETITMSEALAKEPRPALADAITMSEALAKEPQPSLADAITMADTIEKLVAMGALTDSFTMSDSVATAIILILEIADAITLADARTVEAQLAKADAVVLTDALANHFAMAALIDGLSLSDNVATAIVLILYLADALSLSDAGTRQLGKVIADAIELADDAFKQTSIVLGDAMTLEDVHATVRELSAAVSDSITLGDSTVTRILAVAAAVRFWRARQRETIFTARRRETIFNGRPA